MVKCQWESYWENSNVGISQGSILKILLSLIHINDFSGYLSAKAKLFTDDTSLSNVALGINTSGIGNRNK